MLKLLTFVAAVVVPTLASGLALADVKVTNKSSSTISVQIGSGSKTEIKDGEKVIFNTTGGEVKVTVFSGGFEKTSTKVKSDAKVIVTNKNGVWSITAE